LQRWLDKGLTMTIQIHLTAQFILVMFALCFKTLKGWNKRHAEQYKNIV
jgi:thiosulfate reductase cytochrome b subunit